VNSDKRVPFLGDVPLLGRLFRNEVDTKTHSELLVILTPHIVGGDRFELGEPGPASQEMKGYREYSSLAVPPAKKSSGWFEPVFGFLKKLVFLGHE
jgi:hypothetical protein